MKKIMILGIAFMFLLVNTSVFSVLGTNNNIVGIKDLLSSTGDESGDFLTMYDFNGITSPSSDHIASYKLGIEDINDAPPKTGPDVDGLTEFSTSDYTMIYNQDNSWADATSSIGKQLQHFQFNIKENVSEIKSLNIRWLGHASRTHVNLYIWNFKDKNWELIGINRFSNKDAFISKTFINGISNYINDTNGHLYLVAITKAATLLKQHLYTNYIQIKVGNPTTVTLKDDAYHFKDEKNYVEWWFFDVINETQDIQFFITYYIINPINGFPSVDIGVFNGDSIYEIREKYSLSEFYASYDIPDIKIGDNFIEALNENTFLIKGNLNDGKNSAVWNLTFKRTAPPYDFIESAGETEYLCYLPGSWVNGTIELNGDFVSIDNSYGYHDHNWGGELYLPSQWAWAVACKPEDGFALAMEKVEHFKWYTRAIFVTVGDNTIYFEDIDTSFYEYEFKLRLTPPFFTYYPKVRHIHAENKEGYAIDFDAIVQKNIPISMGIPRILNEQVSLFQGSLSKNGQTIYSFNVLGFTDYSVI